MEYEQNKATKLVQMLDSSEMQYKQFWIARTRKAILLWCLCFALIAIATVFIIFGLRERNKYVEYSLHYKKTQSASDDANKLVDEEEDRNASIYDKVGTIKPPKDIEGYELGGEYYNSSNADYILAPESNIANSLTYENSIYTSYRLKYYRLTISSDVNSSSVEFDSGKEKVGFANTFFIVPTDILSTQDVNTSVLTSPYTNDHLYKLYSASVKKKTMTSGTKFSDVDGRSGYHISAFYYNLPDRSVKYSFQPVIVKYDKNATGVSSEASLTHGYSATTYLVTKTITTLVDGKTTTLHTFSNGAEPLIDSKTNTVMSGQMENDMNVYYTTGYVLNNKELVDVNRNANLFKMLSTDVNFYVEWEVDDRYLIAVDLTDEHTFNSIFTSPSEIPYNLDYSQISDRIAAAINDDKTDDWDNLTNVLTNLRDNNGNKIPVDINTSVFLGKVVNGDVISDRITRYLKYGQEVQYKDGDAYYPFAKAGYSIEGKKAEYINWEVLTKEGKWIAATTIKNELSDNCIIIRPKWKADEYTINFTAGENAVIEVTNKNVFKSSSFKGNVEICAQLIQESGVDAKISKLGNRLVGWQLHANLYFNSTVGGVGYPNIAASSDDIKNIIVPSTNIKFRDRALTFKDYEYENYKYNEKVKVARVEETIEEKTIVYNFYYFVDDIIDNNGNLKPNDTMFQMPKGYYSDTKDVNVNAVWEVIKYSITIDFNITKNDVTELTADADQIILADWEDDQIDVAYSLGFDYVYGLAKENGYRPFADKVWNEYPFNVKNNDIDTIITNIGYRKGVTTDMDAVVTIPYIVDTPLYLPKQGEIYRLGYTLVGYEIYDSSDIYNSEKIAKFDIANDSRQIILCSTESDNGIVLRTNKFYVYEDIFIKPVWKPLTIEVDVPKNSQSNEQTTDTYSVINAKSVINYNKENTEITENTYQVVLKNIKNNNIIQNIQILDPHNTAAKDYFSTEATNTTFFSGTAANIYVRLNDCFNTSTFSMDITLSDGLNSYKYTLEDAIDIALGEEFDEDKDYGIFNILDKNSAYYKRFTDKVWSEDVVYTTYLYPTELMSRYYIDYGEDGGKQPALATISISIAEEIGEGWYNIQFQNVAMDMEFALSQISYTLIQNSFMTHPHQYAEDEYKYSLSSLSAYMDSLRANGDCDILTTRINNQEIKYNFVPEQWYMITRWDELVDILEYNRLHDNKIEYVLVNHFKTIDIYNILDFSTDYEDMEYKLAKHNDPNNGYNIYKYEDNPLYAQALRLLGATSQMGIQ